MGTITVRAKITSEYTCFESKNHSKNGKETYILKWRLKK